MDLDIHRILNTACFLGITIFDISEPSHVRYCFVDFHGMESERPVQLMTPLSARVYLEAYYDLSDPVLRKELLPLLHEFNGWDIIPVAALQDTWPDGEWEEPETDLGGSDEITVPKLEKIDSNTLDTSKSLRDRAMATLFQALLDGSDDSTGLLMEAEVLTDFLPKLKGKLYEHANALKPSRHLLDLLCRALEDDTDVDLSPFKGFSAEDISLVVSRLRNHGKMNTLCMSNRPDLTEENLKVVLRGAEGLKALYIMEDPQIPTQSIDTLLDDCDIFHSDLLRRPIMPRHERFYPVASSGTSADAIPAGQVCGGKSISQLIRIGITARQVWDKNYRLDSGLIDWQSLRPEEDCSGFSWDEPYLGYKRHTLDIPLPAFKTVAGLLRLLKWGFSAELPSYNPERFRRGAAFSFATASSFPAGNSLEVDPVGCSNGFVIGPLSTSLYLNNDDERVPSSDDHDHLEFGQWAILLIYEAFDARSQERLDELQHDKNLNLSFLAVKRLRYALVTPSIKRNPSDRDFMVADIPTYLEHTRSKAQDKANDEDLQKLIKVWTAGIAAIDGADFYGHEDIHDILPKVFPNQKASQQGSNPE